MNGLFTAAAVMSTYFDLCPTQTKRDILGCTEPKECIVESPGSSQAECKSGSSNQPSVSEVPEKRGRWAYSPTDNRPGPPACWVFWVRACQLSRMLS